jgi:two-component system chemotaxis response regulator CheB
MKAISDAGSYKIRQDEASCVIFGMPREAIAQGAAHEVLPLQLIAPALLERLRMTAGMAGMLGMASVASMAGTAPCRI